MSLKTVSAARHLNQKKMTKVKRVVATLKFPKTVPAFIIYVRAIILKLTGNPNIPLPYPVGFSTIGNYTTNVNSLDSLEAAVLTHVSGSVASRDVAYEVSKKDMRSIRGMVQNLADNNPTNASIIIESAGLGVKTTGIRKSIVFDVKNTLVSGTVKLIASGIAKSRGSHQWSYSTDLVGFTNKMAVPLTVKSKTTIVGLTPGTKYAFFHTAVVPTGINVEEGPLFLIVI